MYSEKLSKQYVTILDFLRNQRKENFTIEEICKYLDISKPTIIAFEKGKKIRFDLLDQYAAMCAGMELTFDIKIQEL